MDQDGSASGNFGTTALGGMAEAAGRMPEAVEAMLSDSMLGDAQDEHDTEADSMPGDVAEGMLGEDGAAQDAEANSMSAEPELGLETSGSTEAAPADGHPPQMAVLASLDQVCMPFAMDYRTCLQHAHWDRVCMPPFTTGTTCLQHAHSPKHLLEAILVICKHGCLHAGRQACDLFAHSAYVAPSRCLWDPSVSACM